MRSVYIVRLHTAQAVLLWHIHAFFSRFITFLSNRLHIVVMCDCVCVCMTERMLLSVNTIIFIILIITAVVVLLNARTPYTYAHPDFLITNRTNFIDTLPFDLSSLLCNNVFPLLLQISNTLRMYICCFYIDFTLVMLLTCYDCNYSFSLVEEEKKFLMILFIYLFYFILSSALRTKNDNNTSIQFKQIPRIILG